MNTHQESHSTVGASSTSTPAERADMAATPTLALSSHDLLQGRKAVSISHNGALYRLQTTRQGKLILTK